MTNTEDDPIDASTSSDVSSTSTAQTSSADSGGADTSTTDAPSSSSDDTAQGTTGAAVPSLCLEHGYPGASADSEVADVDGDGVDEFWTLIQFEKPGIPRARGYRVEALDVDTEPVDVAFFEADAVALADIDGDGRDDLLRTTMGAWEYRRGQAELTFDPAFLPIVFPPGTRPSLFLDIDGDDDALRSTLTPEGNRVEVLVNEDAAFSVAGSTTVQGNTLAGILGARVVEGTSIVGVELDLDAGVAFLDVLRDVQLVAQAPGDVRFLGGMEVAGEPVGFVSDGGTVEVVALGLDAGRRTIFAEGIFADGAAIGDFEAIGSPQLLYRTAAGLWLKRYPDGLEFEVAPDPNQDTDALPWAPGTYEGGIGVLARTCGFTCELVPARLVEC